MGDFWNALVSNSGYLVFLTTSTGVYALFALGLNLQWGYAGLINFGHVAFMTIGAYTTILLTLNGVPMLFAALAGAALAGSLGLAIGLSTLRLREDYLAIVTIGVSELIRLVALNEEEITRGAFGIQRYPLPLDLPSTPLLQFSLWGLLTLTGIYSLWQLAYSLRYQWRETAAIEGKSYRPRKRASLILWGAIAGTLLLAIYLTGIAALNQYSLKVGLMISILLVLAIAYAGLEYLIHSPWGRILKAIREDEEIPRALGKNVFWYKLQAFMLGGAIAGIAGSFLAWQLTTIYPNNFEPLLTFNAWIIVVLGGSGSNAGTLLGAVIYWAYDSLTRFLLPSIGLLEQGQVGAFRVMAIGLILMVLMVWRPQGILGKKEELTLGR